MKKTIFAILAICAQAAITIGILVAIYLGTNADFDRLMSDACTWQPETFLQYMTSEVQYPDPELVFFYRKAYLAFLSIFGLIIYPLIGLIGQVLYNGVSNLFSLKATPLRPNKNEIAYHYQISLVISWIIMLGVSILSIITNLKTEIIINKGYYRLSILLAIILTLFTVKIVSFAINSAKTFLRNKNERC